jgi:endoglycosylceramidase
MNYLFLRRLFIPGMILPLILSTGCWPGDSFEPARPKSAASIAPFHTEGRWFKDDQGRVVIFRGINICGSVKRDPWEYWTGEEEWDYMVDWGFNLARLLIIWEPIEPEKGRYSDWFFETRTDQQILYAEERGINILLDMHQDIYGPAVSGDGAPEWATRTDIPFTHNSPWGINYLAQAVVKSFDQFWASTELQDHFAGAWLQAVRRYNDRKIVIGYDLYNEPHGGTHAPWEFSRKILGKFQDRVARAIREVDPDRIIFYEPQIYSSSGMPIMLPPPAVKGAALAPHFYDPTLGFIHNQPYDQDPSRIRDMMTLRDKEVKWMGDIPWLMGEFGISDQAENYRDYIRDFYNALDEHMASATLWDYSKGSMGPLNSDGSKKTEFLNEIVRPYPQRIAGEPLEFSFDPETKVFTLIYRSAQGVAGPTELFIPEARHYPGGFRVIASDLNLKTEWDGRILRVFHDPETHLHTITVEPLP